MFFIRFGNVSGILLRNFWNAFDFPSGCGMTNALFLEPVQGFIEFKKYNVTNSDGHAETDCVLVWTKNYKTG